MDLLSWISQARDVSYSAFVQATGAVGAGVGFVQSNLAGTWLFGSTESSMKYDPLMEFDSRTLDFGNRDRQRFFELTCQALSNTYRDILVREEDWKRAKLGVEDVRFLKVICELAKKSN